MTKERSGLSELASLFLKLGVIAFGGPAAHIAMMREEVVEKKKWMSEQHFLDLIGATNLIPGPNSTEMAIHIGRERAGVKGLIIAGCCFILPAVIITGTIAWFYKRYGSLPEVQSFIYGIKAAIISIIITAIIPLAKKSLKSMELWIIGILTLFLCLVGVPEIYAMFGAGFLSLGLYFFRQKNKALQNYLPLLVAANPTVSNSTLFFSFLKIGAILYGSGYVLFAFIDAELVSMGILSRQQLIDAIAVGQFTPGPVFSAVTFIGYQINGFEGAAVSTIGIFIPAFLFVALLNPLVKKMRASKSFAAFLDAVNVASVAVILAVCLDMAKSILTDWRSISISIAALIWLLAYPRTNSAWIIVAASLAGYLLILI